MRRKTKIIAGRVGVLVTIVVLWQLCAGGLIADFQIIDPLFVSQPSAILADLAAYARSGLLLSDLIFTLEEAFIGLLLGIVSGVLLGIVLSHFTVALEILDPYLVAVNSLPRPALAPLLVIWFGLGLASKVFLAWSLVFFVVFYNTLYGIRGIDPDILKAMKVMGATRMQSLRIVVLPSVLSWIFAAFRISVSFALVGAVVGEFVGSTAGLGYRSVIASGLLKTERVFSILLILMVVGTVLALLASMVERRVLKWRPSQPI